MASGEARLFESGELDRYGRTAAQSRRNGKIVGQGLA
jgi:hypothetical protein